MDLIRYSTMNVSAITDTAGKIIDVKRRLGRYVRDVNKAQIILINISQNKKKKGRTFGAYKDNEVMGGFGCRWSAVELLVLLYTLIFTNMYGNTLRFEFTTSILSSANVNIIHRVFHELIVEEELDLLFLSDIKRRNPKSIKDKLFLCGAYDGEDPKSTMAQIQKIMNDKFKYTQNQNKKQPSSGLHRNHFLFVSETKCTAIFFVCPRNRSIGSIKR